MTIKGWEGSRSWSQTKAWGKVRRSGRRREGGWQSLGKRTEGWRNLELHRGCQRAQLTTTICGAWLYNTCWLFFFFKAKPYYCGVRILKKWKSRDSPISTYTPQSLLAIWAPWKGGRLFKQTYKLRSDQEVVCSQRSLTGWGSSPGDLCQSPFSGQEVSSYDMTTKQKAQGACRVLGCLSHILSSCSPFSLLWVPAMSSQVPAISCPSPQHRGRLHCWILSTVFWPLSLPISLSPVTLGQMAAQILQPLSVKAGTHL
jgi:hypothetical protein